MKYALLTVCSLGCWLGLTCMPGAAHALDFEASLNGGYGLSFGIDDVDGSRTGIAFGLDALVDPGVTPGWMFGLEAEYYIFSRDSLPATALYQPTDITFSALPILAIAKRSIIDNLYGLVGVGAVRAATHRTAPGFDETTTSLQAGLMFGAGYSYPLTRELSIDPRLKLHLLMMDSGSVKTVIPSVNVTYRF